ncbi:MAG: hypothetical protein Q4B75_06040 [Eubacteriales bacterium]|nr:hypothetical protein [Eubacteriales bacterium]
MRNISEKIMFCILIVLAFYIKYLHTEIEILRFDCMMKQMKESQNSKRK